MRRSTVLLMIASALISTACVKQPKTPAEFRAAVQGGAFMTKTEQRTVARNFADAFASVRSASERCLNTSTSSSTPGKYGPEVSRLNYRATIKSGATAGEVAVQMRAANMIGDFPEGGPYIFVADVVQTENGASSVTVYAAGKGRDITDQLFAWAAGKSEACPDL